VQRAASGPGPGVLRRGRHCADINAPVLYSSPGFSSRFDPCRPTCDQAESVFGHSAAGT